MERGLLYQYTNIEKQISMVKVFKKVCSVLLTAVLVSSSTITWAEVSFSGQAGPPANKLVLWYRQPATNWMTSALPIGNGRLGAMVFGGVAQEHLQFNEKTLWTGNKTSLGYYQNFGDLYLNFSGLTSVSNYRRELDIEEAISRVSYTVGSTQYSREYFVSYPDQVMVARLTANEGSKLNFDVSLTNAHSGTTTYSGNRITMTGNLTLLSYEAQILVLNEGGAISTSSNKITVSNANSVTLLLAGGTDYDAASPTYKGTDLHTNITNQIDTAATKSYDTLKTAHVNDYKALFNRVEFNLDDTKPTIPTTELITNYNNGIRNPFLEVLYFQYGRYLTIASSRGLGLPANLQGIWNNVNNPPWQSDYHSDVNLEMNYWPTDITNLSECFTPFSDYIYNQAITQDTWKNNATSMGAQGFSLFTQCNIFGYSDWEKNSEANAWYCMNLWDHYAFTQDTNYLLNKAYPVMKSACDFWISTLVTDTDGKLVAPNSWSPEHGNPWREKGTTYAQTLIWDLFTNTIKASEILNIDATYRATLQTKLNQLDPGLRVGSYGQLREWKYQNDVQNEQHRHISHLVGLYPGKQISPFINTTFSEAAKVSLIDRGDGGTGWARAWKINTWARLLDGNHAKVLLQNALNLTTITSIDMSNGGGIYENLLDAHPPFQIDGNFGATAGISEMLLQSYLDNVHILPALPDSWPKGYINGLRARNGFEVDIAWDKKALTQATIQSLNGKTLVIKNPAFLHPGQLQVVKVSDNSPVAYTTNSDTISFNTVAGESYRITSTYVPPVVPIPAGTNALLSKNASANAFYGSETPSKAVDGTTANNSKWCTDQNTGAQWLMVDIGQSVNIDRWVVKHAGAGGESTNYNTKDFKLQKSADGINWTDVDAVTGNTANITDRSVPVFNARYLRLFITTPTQNGGPHSRIYEFEAYVATPSNVTYLSDMTWTSSTNGWGPVEKDKSNGENAANDGRTITLNGVTYLKGLGAHAASEILYNIGGLGYTRFTSDIGVDDEMTVTASIVFQVWIDGVKAYDSGTMGPTTATKAIDLDVTNKSQLKLVITDGGNGVGCDHGDWANAKLIK